MEHSLSHSMAALSFEDCKTESELIAWFWQGTNGNNFIRELNKYAKEHNYHDRIRREKDGPSVYAIVLNKIGLDSSDYKLVKVGFTQTSIKRGSNNRMEQLKREIESKIPNSGPSVLFAVRIGAVDTSWFRDTEDRIRKKVGTPITSAKAKKLHLPVPTEWVLTTQEHIVQIKAKLKAMKDDGAADSIDAFKDIKAPTLPEKYKKWAEEE